MGKIRIKKVGFPEDLEKKGKKKKPKKTAKVPGLKGGERIKAVEGVIIEEEKPKVEKKKEVKKKVKKVRKKGKKYRKAASLVDKTKSYPLKKAIELVKKTSFSQFDGTVEAHLNLLPKYKGAEFLIAFPHKIGKKAVILAFGKGAKEAGADIVGDKKTIEKIAKGFKDFTVVLATPEWMKELVKVAKFLGPRGLMPNPKNGTLTENLKEAIGKIRTGKIKTSAEKKAPLLHLGIGKVSWPEEKIEENLKALVQNIGLRKIKKLTICATMGPGIKVDLASFSS